MELFEYILLMLAALAVSNLVNRFIPSVSVPIIQIALGVAITLLPLHFELTLNPELFLLLFIAPLLFNDGRHADKEALWSLRKPILLLALGLVFVTVGIVGYFVNWLLPVIPLAASFALAAALAPTDAIAVGALEQKVKIPHRTMQLLEGESLINDASGLVSFQFAAAAMATGMFSFRSAGLSFLGISLGGIVLGLLLTLIKYGIVKWLRRLGMENVTLHMLIEILTPFLIFMAAEELGVNGILAVVAAGIAHSFNYKKMNPEVAKLRVVSKSTWSVIIFVLNGLVFLLLGTQLPEIIQTIWNSPEIGNVRVILYTLLLTLAVLGLRLIWVLLMKVPGDGETHPSPRKSRFRTALILSLSGVRGTITLASTLSLPLFLDDGTVFPSRDLIIFLASGVILWTLLASNYLLPLLLGAEAVSVQDEEETQAKIEILRNVVAGLNDLSTEQNRLASARIISTYTSRIRMLRKDDSRDELQRSLGLSVLKWERESTLLALERREVDPYTGYRYLNRINRMLFMHTRDSLYKRELFPVKHWDEVVGILQQARLSRRERRAERVRLRIQNCTYVLEQLNALLAQGGPDLEPVTMFLLQYERVLLRLNRSGDAGSREEYEQSMQELGRIGIQLERDNLQAMFESGRISRQGMKEMKRDILFMEHDLREETV